MSHYNQILRNELELKIPFDENVEEDRIQVTHSIEDFPEFQLLLELFRSTLTQACLYAEVRKTWQAEEEDVRENILEALAWVLRHEDCWLYSLESICDILGLATDQVRRMVFRKLQMTPAEIMDLLEREGWGVRA